MKPLCIYHGGCDDGFAAAWVVRKALGAENVDFHPGVYGQEPPDVAGRDVIMVDFSYKRPVLDLMADAANSILVLDHHKTAQEDLRDLRAASSFDEWRRIVWEFDGGIGALNNLSASQRNFPLGATVGNAVGAIFDMERSGAALAWDYFIGVFPRPLWVEYIQDRDLWRKKMPDGDEFTIALRSYPQEFWVWDELFGHDGDYMLAELIKEGKALQRYYRLRVEELKRSAYPALFLSPTVDDNLIKSWSVWVANVPYFAASEVANELAAAHPESAFGACFFEAGPGRWQYSLRS